jgi:multiple sugar transport system substrate-binding protein
LFDYDTMRPQIDQPPFVRALEELKSAASLCPEGAAEMSPHDARRELLAGRAGMAICWPTAVAAEDSPSAAVRFPVRFAELPGSPEVFEPNLGWETRTEEEDRRVPLLSVAGRLGSVVKGSPRSRSAAGVLVWLSRKHTGGANERSTGPASAATTMYRSSQLQQAARWVDVALGETAARSYADVVAQTHTRSTPLFSVRIPGRERYLAALDEAVHAALSDRKTPHEALVEAAQQWTKISEELGVERQKAAYLRSLGLEP